MLDSSLQFLFCAHLGEYVYPERECLILKRPDPVGTDIGQNQ